MSYIVCRNCKNYEEVDESNPLNFDKCHNCGHILEFAGDYSELQMILNDFKIPDISPEKICTSCKAINPKEAGSCLQCGSSDFQYMYDLDAINNQNSSDNLNMGNQQVNPGQTIVIKQINISPRKNLIFRLISLIIGLIDFSFFTLIGVQFLLGSSELPANILGFVTQNMVSLMLIICVSLILSGLLSILVFPRMSYMDAIVSSSTIGLIVGLSTLLVSKDVVVVIVAIIFCSIFSSLGGLIGEFLIHKIFTRN